MQRENKKSKKLLNGEKVKIAIVVSRFNDDITKKMLNGAVEALEKNKVKKNNIKIIWVPGAFEIPLECQRLAKSRKYDALVALGCVIKGETDHYYFVATESIRGIMEVILKFNIPIGMGVITTNNLAQAKKRSSTKNNKGVEATQAVLEMLN